MSCQHAPSSDGNPTEADSLVIKVVETSAAGKQLSELTKFTASGADVVEITIKPNETYQTITGFGGSFTEASAYLLNQLSPDNRQRILEAYFGDAGARYSLTRTHINS
ncbi:MAG: glycosyl hydrolase family 30, partial [Bacteroidetes bacterium]